MKVLMIAPPYRPAMESALGIATLRPILEAAGHEVSELHGSLLFPAQDRHQAPGLFDWNARHAFGHVLSGASVDDFAEVALQSMIADLDPHHMVADSGAQLWATYGVDESVVRAGMRDKVVRASVCVERMVSRAVAMGEVDVVGFSTMFSDQLPASVVVARHLRRVWPKAKVAIGGAVCLEEQGEGIMATFPVFDAACLGEGEPVVASLVDALCGGGSLANVPGIAWRDGDAVRRNPSPSLVRDMDGIPMPDYREFVTQLSASDWSDEGPDLFFETSRGCWWGQKSLCTFCGLNAEGLAFRSKSPQRAEAEIRYLYGAHPSAAFLRAADNILDVGYIDSVLPKLVDIAGDKENPLRMFFEVKSNMRADQIATLVAGGVREVQPGIESFSDGVLELMRKGNTALGQVQFVKWAAQAGLEMAYNILVLNPGEKTEWYRDMSALVPYLTHLPPPQQTTTVVLERFSPYHMSPTEFGITNVRPKPFFAQVYGEDADTRFAYKFDFDHAMFQDKQHLAAVRALVALLRAWRDGWKPDTAYYAEGGEGLLITDRRAGAERTAWLAGIRARLFRFLDRNRTRAAIERQFPSFDPRLVDTVLDVWLHRRWICRVGERYLAVLPRRGPASGHAPT